MVNPTKRQLAQRYLIEFSGGMMTDDVKVDERFFIQEINQAIAFLAKGSMMENSQLDGIAFANDQFLVNYKNVIIQDDPTSEFRFSILPDSPIGLPRGRGLVMVLPPLGSENSLKPISLREVPMLFHQPTIPKVTFYWIEGGTINYYPKPNFSKVSMKMISSGVSDIDTPLTIPPEGMIQIKAIVQKSVAMLFQLSPDTLNDGEPK